MRFQFLKITAKFDRFDLPNRTDEVKNKATCEWQKSMPKQQPTTDERQAMTLTVANKRSIDVTKIRTKKEENERRQRNKSAESKKIAQRETIISSNQ